MLWVLHDDHFHDELILLGSLLVICRPDRRELTFAARSVLPGLGSSTFCTFGLNPWTITFSFGVVASNATEDEPAPVRAYRRSTRLILAGSRYHHLRRRIINVADEVDIVRKIFSSCLENHVGSDPLNTDVDVGKLL